MLWICEENNRAPSPQDAKNATAFASYDASKRNPKIAKKIKGRFAKNPMQSRQLNPQGLRLVTNEYDDAYNITTVIDANGHRTEQAFNNRNLLVSMLHPDQATETIDCHILNFTRLEREEALFAIRRRTITP